MAALLATVRLSLRQMRKNLVTTVIAILGLAFGIALPTTMFSIVNGTILRGLPFEGSHRLYYLERSDTQGGIGELSMNLHDFVDWQERQQSFEGLAAFTRETFNLSSDGSPPERYEGAAISPNLFSLLKVEPSQGRNLATQDSVEGAPAVALISHSLWERRFAKDPAMVGRAIRLNGAPVEVIGVLPPGMRFPLFQDIWTPLALDPLRHARTDSPAIEAIGLLKRGVPLRQALSNLETITQDLEREHPETNRGIRAKVRSYITLMLSEQLVALLWTMLAASFAVLAISCVNVANLLLARASLRTQEVAVRSSLGATRRRVVGLFLAEAATLSIGGAVIGLILARFAIARINEAIGGLSVPFWIHLRIDLVSALLVVVLIVFTSLIAGAIPAIQGSRADLASLLKDQSRGNSSLRLGRVSQALVVLEVALSCGLLVASGLMIKSIASLRSSEFGFSTDHVLTASLALSEYEYPTPASRIQFIDQLRHELESRPGVQAVAVSSHMPTVSAGSRYFGFEGQTYSKESDYPYAGVVAVSPDYFDTLGTAVLRGRSFSATDTEQNAAVAIVNESLVKRYGRGEDLLGKRIRLGRTNSKEEWTTVIGIAPDLFVAPIYSPEQEGIYRPLAQHPPLLFSVAIRTAGDPSAFTPSLRDAVVKIDRNLPLYNVKTMERLIRDNSWFYNLFGGLFMIFGLIALALAVVGLYGVMAFAVSRRLHEMGLRIALGASKASVIRTVMSQGLRQLGIGLVLGLAFALVLSRFLGFLLFQVQPWDPAIFALVLVGLISTGILACLIPARTALRVDPISALRAE